MATEDVAEEKKQNEIVDSDDVFDIKVFADVAGIVYENESKNKKMDPLPNAQEMNLDLNEWNDWAQKYMLRPKGLERNDLIKMENKAYHDQLLAHLRKLQLFDRRLPKLKSYSYFALHGGTPDKLRERINYCIYLLTHNYICTEDVLYLCGERECKQDEIEYLKTIGIDDSKYFFEKEYGEKMCMDSFKELHEKHKIKVNFKVFFQPKLPNKPRPTTGDLLLKVFQSLKHDQNKPSSVLFISNSPYGPYQHSVLQLFIAKHEFNDKVIYDTVWDQQITPRNTLDYLDAITRTLYNRNKQNLL